MKNPLESVFEGFLGRYGIKFTRPEREQGGNGPNGSLDYFLPDYGLLVELKAWSCERLHRQIGDRQNVMVLVGMDAVLGFGHILLSLEKK